MTSAGLVQRKDLVLALCSARWSLMAACRSTME